VTQEEPHEAIAASIDSAVDQIDKAGGKALFIHADLADENAIKSAVNKAVAKFAGIDILINNVSAFCFTNTINTEPDQFDRLFSVNVRATFLMSQACFPYLKQGTFLLMKPYCVKLAS
jgi:NAD(P)-dependent dehydrogenase (short-subunit alcohol dehydrogenase family)